MIPNRMSSSPKAPPRLPDAGIRVSGTPPSETLLNMELSTLAFNEHVLVLAADPAVPLLERLRFVSILGGNLDEFFMTRVAGYKLQVAAGSAKRTLDGMTPEEQLAAIAERAHPLVRRAYALLRENLLPELKAHGIGLIGWDHLNEVDREYLERFYFPQIHAAITPLHATPGEPLPHVRNLRPSLAVRVAGAVDERVFLLELPGDLPRFVPLPGGRRFIPLEEVIRTTLPDLYPELRGAEAYAFRVARSANFRIEEDDPDEVLEAVEEEVAKRPFQGVVRLEVESAMPADLRAQLLDAFRLEARLRSSVLDERDVYCVDGPVDLQALAAIASLPVAELHYPPLQPASPLPADRPIFDVLREREVLVRFPADSFVETVERFLAEAADDPDVVSVRITLYRTDRSSRIVELLQRARANGKHVVAMIELMASFDERRNIEWARSLEAAGILVVYGPPRLKVHAKIALVERQEGNVLRPYLYIGTGNLNAATAAAYTDLGLFSADAEFGRELKAGFAVLTGEEPPTGSEYSELLVAPFTMRARFLAMIEREAEHARAGRGGHIRAKLNGLADRGIIAALYAASQAGVRIELIVRGLCCLRPGVPGLSENIRVVSILGRFLEHARIFRFDNAGTPEYFIGSADWRPRNLSRRVEVITPVRDPEHRARLDEIMVENLADPTAWQLQPDGSYVR